MDPQRARATVAASEVLHRAASEVARACQSALPGQLIVARVTRELEFGGAKAVDAGKLSAEIGPQIDGWTMCFRRGWTCEDIEQASLQMGARAYKRWKLSSRWMRNHRPHA